MEKLPERIDSKFRFVLLAASRAEQLMRGAQAKIEVNSSKPSRVAREEILQDAVVWDYGYQPEPAPTEAETAEEGAGAELG
jgi:DNA-directed RNA polymerase subunit omega